MPSHGSLQGLHGEGCQFLREDRGWAEVWLAPARGEPSSLPPATQPHGEGSLMDHQKGVTAVSVAA